MKVLKRSPQVFHACMEVTVTGFLSAFYPRGGGGGKMRFYELLGGGGGEYLSVCKPCSKQGGPGACSSVEILDLLLDTIW